MGYSWRMDETYVKIKGEWTYLYRALDKKGHTIDFYLSATRNTQAAKRFLGKALKSMKPWAHPVLSIPTRRPLTGPPLPN